MTRRAGVLGSPVAHTLSPVLHTAAYAELGLDWAYDVIECDERSLPGVLAALAASPDYAGVSLTMPLKAAAYALADHRAPSATELGVANTLVFRDGVSTAHNTDVGGLVAALAEAGVTAAPAALVLGGGGTARAALAALARLGATRVDVGVRRPGAAQELVTLGAGLGLQVSVVGWPQSPADLGGAEVVVSTTPAGATDQLAAGGWPSRLSLVDVVYAPWPTALAAAATQAGAPVVGGLSMLVGQAAEAVALMTGLAAPVAAMRAAGEAALAARTGRA